MSRLLIFLILVNLYVLLLVFLYRTKRLGKDLDLVLGFLLMWKTQRGKAAIERIARPKQAWGVLGDVGIVLTVLAGAVTLLIVLLQVLVFALAPKATAANTPSAEFLLGIPGFNPLIPLGYGILGLAVALVVHEGAHGVLARAGEIKVKSLGLLLAIVPIGAFVEPDEEELERASTRKKLRVFAAGPASNIILCVVAAMLFSGVLMASTSVDAPDGVMLRGSNPGGPADAAGLSSADVITKINGKRVTNYEQFNTEMNKTSANQSVQISFARPGAPAEQTVVVKLSDKYAYYAASGLPNDPANRGKGALEVGVVNLRAYHDVLVNPLASGSNFGTYLYFPFVLLTFFDPMADPFLGWISLDGPLAVLPMTAFVAIAYSLYWLFWLNLMLGTFNALPMGPLDGGQMLKAWLKQRLYARYGVDRERLVLEKPLGSPVLSVRGADPETQAKLDRVAVVLKRATWSVGFTILGMLLIPIVLGSILKSIG